MQDEWLPVAVAPPERKVSITQKLEIPEKSVQSLEKNMKPNDELSAKYGSVGPATSPICTCCSVSLRLEVRGTREQWNDWVSLLPASSARVGWVFVGVPEEPAKVFRDVSTLATPR